MTRVSIGCRVILSAFMNNIWEPDMNSIEMLLRRFFGYIEDRTGVSTVEYALIVVAVIAIVGASAGVLSGAFDDLFKGLEGQIDLTRKQLST